MASPTPIRWCSCGTRLARDNRGQRCNACVRKARDNALKPPDVPPSFWQSDEIRTALASHDMGAVIRAYRTHPMHGRNISQATVGSWMGVTQSRISSFENGERIEGFGKLVRWAQVLKIPPGLLWFELPSLAVAGAVDGETQMVQSGSVRDGGRQSEVDAAELGSQCHPTLWHRLISDPFGEADADEIGRIASALREPRRYLDGTVVEFFERRIDSYMADDGASVPGETLPKVLAILAVIRQNIAEVPAAVRRDLLSAGARGAEFVGWLYRDVRQPSIAGYWHDRATEWAQEACDLPMQGYVLLKKSQMAYEERDAYRVLTLAQAALNGPWQLPVVVRAEVTQQEARGLAMVGESMALIERKLDDARNLLGSAASADQSQTRLGTYYNEQTLLLRTASCYVEAGQPHQAADLYGEALGAATLSKRDRGYFMARQAAALAFGGRPDDAALVGLESAQVANEVASERTKRELRRVVDTLAPWASRPGPRDLREAVAS